MKSKAVAKQIFEAVLVKVGCLETEISANLVRGMPLYISAFSLHLTNA
jgi:hypothetical protein